MNELNEPQLVSLMAWKVVYLIEVLADKSVWYIRINGAHWLGGPSGCPEPFPNIDRAVTYLHAIGCEHVMLHLNRWPELPGKD